MDILLKKGERGIIIGQTGSGKTRGAIWLIQQLPLSPVYIMDTKGEPAFDDIVREGEDIVIYNDGESFVKALKNKVQPVYSIVRPTADEMADPFEMDSILTAIYLANKSCVIYIDEAYQWHVNGRCGSGLIGLLTRGRSKGMTTILSTQRPAWISRFCFSESQRFYVYRLSDSRDMKNLGEFIPGFSGKGVAAKFHWWYYNNSEMIEEPTYFLPVPIIESAKPLITDRWI